MNTDTTVHLGHVQAFFYKLESLAGENNNFALSFRKKKKKKNNFQVSKQFQRTYCVSFLRCIEL